MSTVSTLENSLDAFFLGWAATLVFSMQLGFCCLECGSVRTKNVKNILFKNLTDGAVAGVMFWMIGYAFSYGYGVSGFIGGGSDYFVSSRDYSLFFFQWTFSAAAVSIVSGSVAERCTLVAYLGYSLLLTGLVYPCIVYWVWSDGGYYSLFRVGVDAGAIDFAGSGVVHLTGGVAAFVACTLLGPRSGRFTSTKTIYPHSEPLQAIGVFLLWIGWFGFNGGSVLTLSNEFQSVIFGRVLVCTMLGACSSILMGVIFSMFHQRNVGFVVPMNCCLAGLVSVTAGCSVIEPWASIIIGAIGAIVYRSWSLFMEMMQIDDVVDAVAVHGAAGVWGLVAAALFSKLEFFEQVYGPNFEEFGRGAFYGGNGQLLGYAIALALSIQSFVGVTMVAYFYVMKIMNLLRVSIADEEKGLDTSHHGGPSYCVGESPRSSGDDSGSAFPTFDAALNASIQSGVESLKPKESIHDADKSDDTSSQS